jgi:predicted unusual protein kinase regulating ubiquinone biosynthesis (AarF/ABC1/UbiB family)
MLPPPFYKHMSKLQDKAKPTSYANIKAVFSEEVGREIEDVFDYFEK